MNLRLLLVGSAVVGLLSGCQTTNDTAGDSVLQKPDAVQAHGEMGVGYGQTAR